LCNKMGGGFFMQFSGTDFLVKKQNRK